MTTLTPAQLAGYDRAAGFTGDALTTMVAIQLGESGGDTTAHNTNASTGDDSYGISQINMLGSLGPARLKEFGINAATDLYDPFTNAKAAYTLYKASGFSPWSVYKSGAYKSHLDVAKAASSAVPSDPSKLQAFLLGLSITIPGFGGLVNVAGGAGGLVADASSGITSTITNAVNSFSKTIFNSVADIAAIGVAIALLVLGFVIINRKSVGSVSKVAEVAAL